MHGTILQISDLHFGAPYNKAAGEALLRIARELDLQAIIISGDLTQRAKIREFEAARDFMAQLPDLPKLVIPGNHDVPLYRVWERLTRPYGLYDSIITPDRAPTLEIDGAFFVGIDSTAPRRAITNGRISRRQLDATAEAFSRAPRDAAKIVVSHHHLAPAPDILQDYTLPQARRAMDAFVEMGVEMTLGGHLHRSYIGNSMDFYPGLARDTGIVIVQCGTTTSQRGRGREADKNSFNLIHFDEETLSVTHYLLMEQEERFASVSQHQFPRRGRRGLF